MFCAVVKGLDDGAGGGAEDDGDINISRITTNISEILTNRTKQSDSTMQSSTSLNNISTPRQRPTHNHIHRHLTIRRSSSTSSINRCHCRGRHFKL